MDKSKSKNLATLLPWLGLFLLTPPILLLFNPETTIFAIPVLPAYLFLIWFLLILVSRHLSKYLGDDQDQSDQTSSTPINGSGA